MRNDIVSNQQEPILNSSRSSLEELYTPGSSH